MTLEQKITELHRLRQEMADLNSRKSDLQAIMDNLEYQIVEDMQGAGITRAGTSVATVSIKEEKYPKIVDMEAFTNWCVDNGQYHMIQRRVSKTAFDEYFGQTNEYPEGIDTYDKLSLSMRKK